MKIELINIKPIGLDCFKGFLTFFNQCFILTVPFFFETFAYELNTIFIGNLNDIK